MPTAVLETVTVRLPQHMMRRIRADARRRKRTIQGHFELLLRSAMSGSAGGNQGSGSGMNADLNGERASMAQLAPDDNPPA